MLFASRRNGRSFRHSALLTAAVTGLGLAASAHAATITWQNTGTNFNNPASWGVATINAVDDALFTGAVVSQPQLSANITLAQVRFSSTASGYNITAASGQALSLTATGTSSSAATGAALVGLNATGTNTITADIILARTGVGLQAFNQVTNGTLDILGNISSTLATTGLLLNGTGTVRLLGTNNTFGGGLNITNGNVHIGSGNAIGSGTLVISGGNLRSSDDTNRTISNLANFSGTFTLGGGSGTTGNLIFTNTVTLIGNTILSAQSSNPSPVSAVAFEGLINEDATPRTFSIGTSTSGNAGGYVFLMHTANSFTGQASIGPAAGGSSLTVVTSLRNIGAGGDSLGNQPDAATGTLRVAGGNSGQTSGSGTLRYIGGTTSTNRAIDMIGAATNLSFSIDASGYGAITFTNNISMTGTAGGTTRNIGLVGIGIDDNTFSGAIPNGITNTSLTKAGTGTWVVKGANTFTGGISITSGKLVLDYTANANVIATANTLSLTGGTLALRGAASGTTSQTLGAVTLVTGGGNQLLFDLNGGSGITLTTGAWSRNAGSTMFVDLPTGAAVLASPGITNSIIPYMVVRDGSGTGYGTVASGSVVRYTAGTAMTIGTETGVNTNFNITGGLTLGGASRTVGSLAIDTATGGTLDLNALTLTLGNQRSVLFTGTSNYLISNGTLTGAANEVFLHQYSSGVVTISATAGSTSGTFTKSGGGTLVMASKGSTGIIRVVEGALRANASVIATGAISLTTGGVLELSDSNFTGSLGTAAGNVQIVGDGGFSAFGATRTVQLTGGTILWNATNFVPSNNALVLSGKDSNAMVDFQNGLGFGNQQRVVHVNNGSAVVDARLSGVLSGAYGGGLIKRGAGALEVTNANTYIGETWVQAGSLYVNNTTGSGTGTGKVTVFNGGTLGGTGTIAGLVNIQSGGTLAPGNSPGIQNYNAGLTFDSGSNYNWEHNAGNALGTAGTNFDVANITGGTLTVTSGAKLNLLFASGTTFNDSFWNSNRSWNIVTGGATGSNFFGTSNIFVNVNGSPVDGGDNVITGEGSFSTAVSGSNVVLTWTALVGGTPAFSISPGSVNLNTLKGAAAISSTLTLTNVGTASGNTTIDAGTAPLSVSPTTHTSIGIGGTANSIVTLSTGSYATGSENIDITQNAATSNTFTTVNYNVGNAATGTGSTFGTALSGASTGTGNALSSITSDTEARVLQITNGLNVTMDWREAGADVAPIVGDVVRVITTDNAYVLIMTYADNPSLENSYFLGTRLPSSNFWTGAGNMNTANLGSYTTQTTVGMWGNDTANNYVWAIIDGTVSGATNEFAVIPEPASLMLLGLGAVGLLARRRR